jgi:AcrR family transcriptional regulator
MPAIVDHQARRAILARIAADIIAARGIEAATVRAIADAAGSSTKIVSHYFRDKRALLMATYRSATDDSSVRAVATQDRGRADVCAYLLSLLPASGPMLRNWKVWLAFWAYAISDPEFAEEQRGQVLGTRAQVARLLEHDPSFSGLETETRTRAARDLLTVVIGVALQAAFDPEDWPPERQGRPVVERLAALSAA